MTDEVGNLILERLRRIEDGILKDIRTDLDSVTTTLSIQKELNSMFLEMLAAIRVRVDILERP